MMRILRFILGEKKDKDRERCRDEEKGRKQAKDRQRK
jgi:hypothetical protein